VLLYLLDVLRLWNNHPIGILECKQVLGNLGFDPKYFGDILEGLYNLLSRYFLLGLPLCDKCRLNMHIKLRLLIILKLERGIKQEPKKSKIKV